MSLGSVSLNMVWNPAIKGSSFLQASMKGIHTYAKSVTKANLLGSTKFSLLNRNIKSLENHLGKIRTQTAKISANPIRLDIKSSRASLTGAKKDMHEIERSAKQTAFYSKKNAENLRLGARVQRNNQRKQKHNTGDMLGGAMLMGAIAMPFTAGVSFEAKMTDVRALTKGTNGASSITDEEFDLLNAKAKKLGATTEWSAVQASEGMSFLAKAGFDTKQQLGAMDGVLGLATVGNVDLGTSADIASNILSGFSIDASKMNDVANVLAKTFTTSNTDLVMLGETMKYTGAMASGLGVGVSEVSALAGKLGDVGIQGSMAGTSLRQMYSRMSAPPTEARKAMERLGISAYDAQGKFKGLPALIGEINTQTKGMDNGTKNKLLKDMFGMTALSSGIALLKVGKENLELYQKSLEGNEDAIARIRKMKLNTVQGQFKLLGSAFEGLSISVTTGLLTPLKLIVSGITSVVNGITWFTDTFPVLGSAILAVGSTLAVGMVALTAFGFLASGLSVGLGMLSTGFTAVSGAIMFMGRALLMNPIGLIITAIATTGYLIYDNWEFLKTSAISIWDGISSYLSNVGTNIKNGFISIFDWSPLGLIINNWGKIGTLFTSITDMIKKPFVSMFDWLDDKFKTILSIKDKLSGLLSFGSDDENKNKTIDPITSNKKQKETSLWESTKSIFSWGSDDKKSLSEKPRLLKNTPINNVDYKSKILTSSLKEVSTENIVPIESVSDITNKANIENKQMMLNNNSNRNMNNTFNIEIKTNGTMPDEDDIEDFKLKVKNAIDEINDDYKNIQIAG